MAAAAIPTLQIETELEPEALRARLAKWEPWAVLIEFSNGVSTAEFEHLPWFRTDVFRGLELFEQHIPFQSLVGGDLLDVGCNCGYNSIYFGTKYELRPVGIDVVPRLLEAARFLARSAQLRAEFVEAHADSFCRPASFDVILHLGALYHLQNPLRSLQSAYESLKPGGYLALETACFEDPTDQRLCYFLHGNGDPSNFFALSPFVIRTVLELLGFDEVQEINRQKIRMMDREHLFRIGVVARKKRHTDLSHHWPKWA